MFYCMLDLSQNIFKMAEKKTEPNSAPKNTCKTENVSKEVLEKLSEQLLCSVCMKEYTKPRVLPCLHVFCEACLEKMVETETDKQNALCPKCSKAVPLSQGGVSSLPAAFYIQHLFEVRETLKKVCSSNEIQCNKCGEGEAKGFCRDCGHFFASSARTRITSGGICRATKSPASMRFKKWPCRW